MTTYADLSLFRGESASWDLYFTNVDKTSKSLTGVLVEFLLESSPTYAVVLTRSTVAGGIVINADQVNAGKGHATLSLVPGDTSSLTPLPAQAYTYKIRTTDADGFVSVAQTGLFTLTHE